MIDYIILYYTIGADKSHYHRVATADGSARWVEKAPPPDDAVKLACDVCAHVYDPLRDCGGMANPAGDCQGGVAFEDLPETWRCPVCGVDKSHYHRVVAADGAARWVEKAPPPEAREEKPASDDAVDLACDVCAHVYDPLKDCGGIQRESLVQHYLHNTGVLQTWRII